MYIFKLLNAIGKNEDFIAAKLDKFSIKKAFNQIELEDFLISDLIANQETMDKLREVIMDDIEEFNDEEYLWNAKLCIDSSLEDNQFDFRATAI